MCSNPYKGVGVFGDLDPRSPIYLVITCSLSDMLNITDLFFGTLKQKIEKIDRDASDYPIAFGSPVI